VHTICISEKGVVMDNMWQLFEYIYRCY